MSYPSVPDPQDLYDYMGYDSSDDRRDDPRDQDPYWGHDDRDRERDEDRTYWEDKQRVKDRRDAISTSQRAAMNFRLGNELEEESSTDLSWYFV